MPDQNIIEILKHTGIAVIGGIAKYSSDYYRGVPFNWRLFLAKLVVCGFVGFLFSLVFSVYATEWRFVASALGGYVGTEMLDASVFAFVKKTGKTVLGVDMVERRNRSRARRSQNPEE